MLTRCPSMVLSWPCGTLAFQSSNYHKLVGKCYLALVRGQRNYGRMSPESQAGGVAVCPPSVLFWIMIDFSCRSLYHCLTSSYSLTLLISTPFSFELPSFTSSTPSIFSQLPSILPPSIFLLHPCLQQTFPVNIITEGTNLLLGDNYKNNSDAEQQTGCVCVFVSLMITSQKKEANKQTKKKQMFQ